MVQIKYKVFLGKEFPGKGLGHKVSLFMLYVFWLLHPDTEVVNLYVEGCLSVYMFYLCVQVDSSDQTWVLFLGFVFVLILKQDISLSFANEACLASKQDRQDT